MTAPQFVTFLRVRDIHASTAFYEEKLGLQLALDQSGCRIYRLSPGAFLGLCEGDPGRDPGTVCLTWVVEDVTAHYQRLAAVGVETDGPVRVNERYQIEHFFASDPDGHRLEFQRFLNPDWPTG